MEKNIGRTRLVPTCPKFIKSLENFPEPRNVSPITSRAMALPNFPRFTENQAIKRFGKGEGSEIPAPLFIFDGWPGSSILPDAEINTMGFAYDGAVRYFPYPEAVETRFARDDLNIHFLVV